MPNLSTRFGVLFWVAVITSTAPSAADEMQQDFDSAKVIEQFNASNDGVGVLSLPVTINSKKFNFILDTGSSGVLYDVAFLSILGKPKKQEKAKTQAGTFELTTFNSPEAFIGGISLKTSSDVVTSDLRSIREWSGGDYYGVIGMSFLKNHILRIDFDKGVVSFLRVLGSKPGHAFPLFFEHGVIYTEAFIPGCERKEKFW